MNWWNKRIDDGGRVNALFPRRSHGYIFRAWRQLATRASLSYRSLSGLPAGGAKARGRSTMPVFRRRLSEASGSDVRNAMGLAHSTLQISYSDTLPYLMTKSDAQSGGPMSATPLSFCYKPVFVAGARAMPGRPSGVRALRKHHDGAEADGRRCVLAMDSLALEPPQPNEPFGSWSDHNKSGCNTGEHHA